MDTKIVGKRSKMIKLESSISILNLEISTTTNFLQLLRKSAMSLVKNLNNNTSPSAYLQEYLNVHSFIMKYLSFLTEINCKFEILGISSTLNGKPHSPVALMNKNDSNSTEMSTVTNKKRKNSKKKSRKPKQSQNGKNKAINASEPVKSVTSASDKCRAQSNSNTTAVGSSSCNSRKAIQTKKEKDSGEFKIPNFSQKNNSTVSKNDVLISIPFEKNDLRSISPEKVFKSETNLVNSQITQGKGEQQPVLGNSTFPAATSSEKIGDSTIGNNCHLNDFSYNSEISNNISCTQDLEKDHVETAEVPKQNENESDDIKPVEIIRQLGMEYDVVIEHIKSPSEFYISLTDEQLNLRLELEKKLRAIPFIKSNVGVKKNEKRKSWLSKEIGKYALVYSKCDETWLRGKITSWGLDFNDDFVHVFLIDYGESKCVLIDDIGPMPASIKCYPALTERCHLSGILPTDMDSQSDTIFWEKEATEKMKSLTEISKRIRLKIASNDSYHSLSSLPVTLWLLDNGNQCVNDLLVETQHAVSSSVCLQSTKKTEVLKKKTKDDNEILNDWNPMKEDFESYENSYDLDMNDPAAFIYGYVSEEHKRICKLFAETGYCFKGNACKKEHKKLDPLGFTTDQQEVYHNAFNTLVIPSPKSVINVQVTYVADFNQFFCILESDGLFSEDEDLQSLLKFMNSDENVRSMKKLLIPPSAGEIVIGRYYMDNAWYRARVLESEPENDKYKVVFVDFGNTETLPLSEIRAIEGRYLHLPFQAMQCQIFGIRQNFKVPPEQVMNYVYSRLDDSHISIEVIARLPGEHISLLVHVLDHKGRSIAEDLLDKGYAVSKEEILINPYSESMPG